MSTHKISGTFSRTISDLKKIPTSGDDGDLSVVRTDVGDATGGDWSVVRTDVGDATGGDWSVVRTNVGNATGGDLSVVRTNMGDATGGDRSAVRTSAGDATGGDRSVVMGSGTLEIGKNSVAVRLNKNGGIIKIIVNTDNDGVQLRIENADAVEDRA